MPRVSDVTQAARAFKNRVMRILDAEVLPSLYSLVQRQAIQSVTGGAGSRPVATGPDDELIAVYEPYGFASTPPGTGLAVVFAPGTDSEDRVAVGISSTGSRPATSAGDSAHYTAAGHVILLDDDGGITITSKDGAVIDMPVTGAITISAGPSANVTINVDAGASANIGDATAVALLRAQLTETFLSAALTFGANASIPNDGGKAGLLAAAAFVEGVLPAPPPGLASAAGTTKAKGI